MKKSKETEEEITWEDFKAYLPKHDFDKKQMDFFKSTLDYILHRSKHKQSFLFLWKMRYRKIDNDSYTYALLYRRLFI